MTVMGLASDTAAVTRKRCPSDEPWSIPEKVAGPINTDGFEARPALSYDARTLYFTVLTPEGHDLLVSTRAVLRHHPERGLSHEPGGWPALTRAACFDKPDRSQRTLRVRAVTLLPATADVAGHLRR